MLIALVGRAFSDKSKIASNIIRHYNGEYSRLRPYEIRDDNSYSTNATMSEDDYEWNKYLGEVFYSETSVRGNKTFFLKSQFLDKNLVYTTDDPRVVSNLSELGVPYSVVFVDCAYGKIYSRAKEARVRSGVVKARLDRLANFIKKFGRSRNYSAYFNTTNMTYKTRTMVVELFCDQVDKWLVSRDDSELCMPTIVSQTDEDWLQTSRDVGYFIVDITGGS